MADSKRTSIYEKKQRFQAKSKPSDLKSYYNSQTEGNSIRDKQHPLISRAVNPNPRANTYRNKHSLPQGNGKAIAAGIQISTNNRFEPLSHRDDYRAKPFKNLVEAHEIRRQELLSKRNVEEYPQTADKGWQIVQR